VRAVARPAPDENELGEEIIGKEQPSRC